MAVLGPETLTIKRKGGKTVVVDLVEIETPQSAKNANPAAFEGVPSSQQGRQLLGQIHTRTPVCQS
ncbi:hypothetical protein [Halomicrococcus sp. SG-WS-1]|uniref:hypothetical protein n=1 Tax=Halomicrococcus sp. SG-WS-1 TaxID=3439057 RepID=UPI003F7937C8